VKPAVGQGEVIVRHSM